MKRKISRPPTTQRASRSSAQAPPAKPLRCVYTSRQIQGRVRQLARQINRDYKGRTLHVVGILEDCFIFMADLVRNLTVPVVCHFIKAQIRDTSEGPIAVREIMYIPKVEAAGRHVLLVNGILQSGVTLDHLCRYILGQNPKSLRTATLIEKTVERRVDVPTDYVGFATQERFLVGYGLDYQEEYRNLPYIARLAKAV